MINFDSKSKPKPKQKKEIEKRAPWYKYNPYTPHYFTTTNVKQWYDYLERCSESCKMAVKAKCDWLHHRIAYYWRLHRSEPSTLQYYNRHYGPDAKKEDRLNPMLMSGRLMYDYSSISRRLETSWDKPPPAMASIRYWETFLYNCMDIAILNKLDIVVTSLINYLSKKKENPNNDKGRKVCLNYLEKRKTMTQEQIDQEDQQQQDSQSNESTRSVVW